MRDLREGQRPEPKSLEISVFDEIHIKERLKLARIRSGQRKPDLRVDVRDDVDRETGQPTTKTLRFDREGDLYTETVVVKATGERLVNKHEPLSQHRGRGSAKLRIPESGSEQ